VSCPFSLHIWYGTSLSWDLFCYWCNHLSWGWSWAKICPTNLANLLGEMSGVTCAFRNFSIIYSHSEVKRRPKIEIWAGALLNCSAAFYSDLWISLRKASVFSFPFPFSLSFSLFPSVFRLSGLKHLPERVMFPISSQSSLSLFSVSFLPRDFIKIVDGRWLVRGNSGCGAGRVRGWVGIWIKTRFWGQGNRAPASPEACYGTNLVYEASSVSA